MGEAYTELQDTGDFLEVPEDQRYDIDDPDHEDANEDEFADLSHIPDGDYVVLSTASDDEPIGFEEED